MPSQSDLLLKSLTMSPHAPAHLKNISQVLMAGEDVRWMARPNIALLLLLECIVAGGSGVVLWVLTSIFAGDLPMGMRLTLAAIAALLGVGILHGTIGMRRYVVTDQRLLVITGFSHDVHDSCDLGDIVSVRMPRFSNSLIVERNRGKPIRLWAVASIKAALDAMGVAVQTKEERLSESKASESEESDA
jgi:hypothetical protein